MDHLDAIIKRVAAVFHEGRRQEAARRRLTRDAEGVAKVKVAQIEDRIAFNFPIKSREECPTLSDAEYKRYVTERQLHRHQLLLWTIAALGANEPQGDGDWDQSGGPFVG
jgi:hypothetical protein